MSHHWPRLPAEWEPQSGVVLTWPHAGTDWAVRLPDVLPTFAQIATAISRDETVLNLCCDGQHQAEVAGLLRSAGARPHNLRFALVDSDDTWARDHAPITTLTADGPCLNDFIFGGWGGKFAAAQDNRINRELDRQGIFARTPMVSRQLVLEGGALETDGLGTLLATRSSVLDPARNPETSSADIEQFLRDTLGFTRFLWLDHGELSGDDTDAHIDILARFTDPHTIVFASAPENDPDHAGLAAMQQQLRGFRDIDGNPYRLRELPFPGVHQDAAGRRLPAGYANFLVTNQSVLVPVYGVAADTQALQLLDDCFPGRRVVPVDCRAIIEQNGSLHCLTMQFPAGVPITNAVDAIA
jgi:agmatine/peptidylarginine deiminase